MPAITWDNLEERVFETGVDHGVLYLKNEAGLYTSGVPWNGLVNVTEKPSGAEATPLYADNIKYLNLVSAEDFACTIEAFTYPEEFEECDGSKEIAVGISAGQQERAQFGFCYRSLIGDGAKGTEAGYKLHLVYGCLAAPTEKARGTVNEKPEALNFSWTITTTPVSISAAGIKPTAKITIDSTKTTAAKMTAIEKVLYGADAAAASLPLPDALIALGA